MQRPRRTSELYEEPAIKRQSRQSQRPTPTPGTAQKYVSRQNRNTALRQTSSLDRGHTLQPSTSANKSRCFTPQRTPSTKRILFTAEKQLAFHNDKKWVQEQTNIITDHLRDAVASGRLTSLSAESLGRSNFLRQMSIKQFVAIVNYFLHFACGNRFTVGVNHVEDIVNILQKLEYPHQVNKSWLKTPNTQHSFGHVIVLLDFLMGFVPQEIDMQRHPHELQANGTSDSEIRELIFQHSMEGFKLWDKQLMKEFSALQQKTADDIILKQCGVAGSAALDAELKQLKITINELEKNSSKMSNKSEEKHYHKLSKDLKYNIQKLEMLQDDNRKAKTQLDQLATKRQASIEERSNKEAVIARLEIDIRQQTCNVDQRNKHIEDAAQLKYMIKSQEREISDVQSRLHHDQVLISRAKKQLNDKIGELNACLREITFVVKNLGDDLKLPLNLNKKDLQPIMAVLQTLHRKIKTELKENAAEQQLREQQALAITNEINTIIKPKCNSIENALKAKKLSAQQYDQQISAMSESLDQKQLDCETEKRELLEQIENLQRLVAQQTQQLSQLEQKNQKTMADAEQEYNEDADKREAAVDSLIADLEAAKVEQEKKMDELQQNSEQIRKAKEMLNTQK